MAKGKQNPPTSQNAQKARLGLLLRHSDSIYINISSCWGRPYLEGGAEQGVNNEVNGCPTTLASSPQALRNLAIWFRWPNNKAPRYLDLWDASEIATAANRSRTRIPLSLQRIIINDTFRYQGRPERTTSKSMDRAISSRVSKGPLKVESQLRGPSRECHSVS